MVTPRQFLSVVFISCALPGMGQMDCHKEFEAFVKKYDKKYADEKEHAMREAIFVENCEWILLENQKNHTYTLGITKFSDLRSTEFHKKYYKASKPSRHVLGSHGKHVIGATRPESVDWVDQGMVTNVKDQGKCGTCWTFGATATIESAVAINGGELVSLSPQELQDCDGDHSCDGHNSGGNEKNGFDYAKKNGLASFASYKFVEGNETCQDPVARALQAGVVTGYNVVDPTMEALMDAVAQQPVNIGLNAASGGQVQQYKGGILKADCKKGDDHAVVLVGYGTENGVDYWKLRNSWGADWGEQGYFRLERGKDQCGVLDDICYPTVSLSREVKNFKDILV